MQSAAYNRLLPQVIVKPGSINVTIAIYSLHTHTHNKKSPKHNATDLKVKSLQTSSNFG